MVSAGGLPIFRRPACEVIGAIASSYINQAQGDTKMTAGTAQVPKCANSGGWLAMALLDAVDLLQAVTVNFLSMAYGCNIITLSFS